MPMEKAMGATEEEKSSKLRGICEKRRPRKSSMEPWHLRAGRRGVSKAGGKETVWEVME